MNGFKLSFLQLGKILTLLIDHNHTNTENTKSQTTFDFSQMKCVIEQKHHRAVLGQKGSHVQGITGRFNVQIKFPERKNENASETAAAPVTPTTPEAAEPSEPVTAETTAEVSGITNLMTCVTF